MIIRCLIRALTFFLLAIPLCAVAEIVDTTNGKQLFLKGPSPVLTIPTEDWTLEQKQERPGSTAVYYLFRSPSREMMFSIYIDRTDSCRDAAACLQAAMTNPSYKSAQDAKRFESGSFQAIQFFLDRPANMPVQQANIMASAYIEGVWLDMHISRSADMRPDMAPLRAFLDKMTLVAPAVGEAAATRELNVALTPRGSIVLSVPAAWFEEIVRAGADIPPTIRLRPPGGGGIPFLVLITPIWSNKPDSLPPTPESTRAIAANSAKSVQPKALERDLPLREFNGAEALGYYFSATDANPPKGEYKFLTQGAARLGDLQIAFTILSNDETGTIAGKALEMLKSMRRLK
jgi:hypothetical protein